VAILKFDQTSRQAFATGFLKGLSAPLELFRLDGAPVVEPPANIEAPQRGVQEALAADWNRIGFDMKSAISQYKNETEADSEQTTSGAATSQTAVSHR
jgi:hypothetical protein